MDRSDTGAEDEGPANLLSFIALLFAILAALVAARGNGLGPLPLIIVVAGAIYGVGIAAPNGGAEE